MNRSVVTRGEATPRPQRARCVAVPKGRAATILRLIDTLAAKFGRPPTDTELAAMLATSEVHVARVRRKLEGAE